MNGKLNKLSNEEMKVGEVKCCHRSCLGTTVKVVLFASWVSALMIFIFSLLLTF